MSAHVPFDRLNDYVDGTLPRRERAQVEAHLAGCAGCRHEVDSLRAVLERVARAPRSISPDDALWRDVRAAIDERRVVTLPAGGSGRAGRPLARWSPRERSLLAVAAMLLVVVTAALTTVVLRSSGDPAPGVAAGGGARAAAAGLLPASFRSLEADYERTAAELATALDAGRGTLAPETIATIERSLRVIDDAIREARAALLDDPANATLVDLLASTYEQKLELLRRAAELTTTTI
jgi:hypothetical protein